MSWQEYAAERDADLKLAEEKIRAGEQKISELKEEVRGLQRQLIAADSKTPNDLQQTISTVQQQLVHDRQLYNQQMNGLRQEYHNLMDQHRATQNELGGVTRQLNETKATNTPFQARSAGQTPMPTPVPSPPTKTVAGGVSLEGHCAILTRRLKTTQKENARLQQLSDRPVHGKSGACDDDDDEEPEI